MASKSNQLSEEILKPVTLRHIFLFLTIPWLIVGVINFYVGLYLKYFPENKGYWLIKKKWEMLLYLKQPVDWLILGDSSCNQGVDPSIFREKLNASAINLCTIGDTLALNDAWMLSKYIEKYGAPKNVLIVHVYDVWHRDINWNVTGQTPLAWGYWKKLKPQLELNYEDLNTVFVNKYVPLYSQNESIKEIIKNPDTWFKRDDYDIREDGFMSKFDVNPGEVKLDSERHINLVKNKQFSLSSPNQKSLEQIVALAEQYNFNVYLTNSPLYEGLYQNKNFRAYFSQVQKTLRSVADKSDRVHYILQKPITFPKIRMQNADHVIESAAKEYTHKLVSEVRSKK